MVTEEQHRKRLFLRYQTRVNDILVHKRSCQTIVLYVGGMFSGKTESLMREVRRKRVAGKECLLVRHGDDNRYDLKSLCSHAEQKDEDCISAKTIQEIEQMDLWRYEELFIDEGQFFVGLKNFCLKWRNRGLNITVAALDTYSNQTLWPEIQNLLPHAIKKFLKAVCIHCGSEDATLTELVTDGGGGGSKTPTTKIGGTETYRATCSGCLYAKSQKLHPCVRCGSVAGNSQDFDIATQVVCEECMFVEFSAREPKALAEELVKSKVIENIPSTITRSVSRRKRRRVENCDSPQDGDIPMLLLSQ